MKLSEELMQYLGGLSKEQLIDVVMDIPISEPLEETELRNCIRTACLGGLSREKLIEGILAMLDYEPLKEMEVWKVRDLFLRMFFGGLSKEQLIDSIVATLTHGTANETMVKNLILYGVQGKKYPDLFQLQTGDNGQTRADKQYKGYNMNPEGGYISP